MPDAFEQVQGCSPARTDRSGCGALPTRRTEEVSLQTHQVSVAAVRAALAFLGHGRPQDFTSVKTTLKQDQSVMNSQPIRLRPCARRIEEEVLPAMRTMPSLIGAPRTR